MAYGAILGQRFQPYSPEPPGPVALSELSEGAVIKIKESGSPVDFYVAKHDYESDLNGAGRTLVVRKDTYDDRAWDAGNVNAYASSDIDAWFNGTYKTLFSQEVQTAMGTTKFYYTPGSNNWTVTTLERAIFALSLTELRGTLTHANTEGTKLSIASTLWEAYRDGSPATQWTRSPLTNNTNSAWRLIPNGTPTGMDSNNPEGSRPCFCLPSTALVDSDNNLIEQ